ncbi:CAP domain-containing protein [Gracilibacillus caseinilyticus]|uniref:CAP domain-containing protein n=1 Tax=Gracilibacillus caseinilyticus TaxID=2932256 RepID=A0ABY4F0M5_9BACI|nr:CAP domain-containing protein [Gracilibacillus caseinilyticus]UOQ47981.1 CAP domain-containing protein [Gracilibacillus caseinilyticus]
MKIKVIFFIAAIFLIVLTSVLYVNLQDEPEKMMLYHQKNQQLKSEKVQIAEDHSLIVQQHALWKLLNRDIRNFTEKYGEPDRKDPSIYGFEWWIYRSENKYVQVAVKDEQLVSMYTNSGELDFQPIKIGQTVEEINELYPFEKEIEFDQIRFQLTEDDLKERPVIKLNENIYAQLYVDQYTEKLAGIRVLNKEVLEVMKPYELYYWGELKETEEPNEEEKMAMEKGMEQQIFDLTNIIRQHHQLSTLEWDEHAAVAAKTHSKDMQEENYFSHYSLNGDGLKERLVDADAYYLSAGENIAAHYVDAPAVIHGWLNSEGHRDALLKEEYTHLGVGVYQSFYTQNFIEK